MPGTVVRDSIAPNLLSGVTLTTAAGANQAGTAWEALWPGNIQFTLVPTAKSGTTPQISVDIQGCETSDFSTADVVTLGTIVAADPTLNASFGFETYVDAKYVRAVSTVTGTTGTFTATIVPVPPHDRRRREVTPAPSAKALA
jgi:hypothetical protein